MRRDIAVCIILTILTCGIYGIYWMIQLNDELLAASGRSGQSGVVVFLLGLVTCGIYLYIWHYQMGEAVVSLHASVGKPNDNTPILYLVLALVGFGIVNYALMQNELNQAVA